MCDRAPSTLLSSTFLFPYPTLAALASWPLPCCSLYLDMPLLTPLDTQTSPFPYTSWLSFYLSPSKMLYSSRIYFTYFSSSLITVCAPPQGGGWSFALPDIAVDPGTQT